MFKDWFKKSRDVLSDYKAQGEESGVLSLALTGVSDPFDPDPLWDRKYGGNSEIVEEMGDDKDFRLQAALDGCRDTKFVRDEAGRFREQTPVFTDVVMWVAESLWRADAQQGGYRIEAFVTNIAKLHAQKFARSLPGDRDPRYVVMPDPDLAENSVLFQFGRGVFVPSEADSLLGSVALKKSLEDDAVALPEWSFWEGGKQRKRPVGVYQSQGAIMLTANKTGPVRAPVWFADPGGSVSVNLSAADSDRIFASDPNVDVAEAIAPRKDGDPFQWVLQDRRGGPADQLIIEVTVIAEPSTRVARPVKAPPPEAPPPAAPTPAAPEPTPASPTPTSASPPPDAPASGLDRFFSQTDRSLNQANTPISSRFSLRLAGCALLRIDGPRRLPGLEEWVIWFDANGHAVQHANARDVDTGGALALAATAHSQNLFYRLPGSNAFKPVQVVPCVLEASRNIYLDLVPSPAPEAYHALVMLPQEQVFPVSSQPLLLGRSDAGQQATQPDLPLELLDHPQSLRWQAGQGSAGARLNSLNLSRRHVSVRLMGNRLEIGMVEGKMPVYVLDGQGALLKVLDPSDRATLLMEAGEMMVVGSYVLRFHEERPMTMLSRRAGPVQV